MLKDTLVDKCPVLLGALLKCWWLHFCTTTGSAGLLHMCEWRFGGLYTLLDVLVERGEGYGRE